MSTATRHHHAPSLLDPSTCWCGDAYPLGELLAVPIPDEVSRREIRYHLRQTVVTVDGARVDVYRCLDCHAPAVVDKRLHDRLHVLHPKAFRRMSRVELVLRQWLRRVSA